MSLTRQQRQTGDSFLGQDNDKGNISTELMSPQIRLND